MSDLPYDLYLNMEKFIEEDMKPIVYYYKNMTPSEYEKYLFEEVMADSVEQNEKGLSDEEMLWLEKQKLKNECKPLFDKLHEIIKDYI